VFFFACKLGIRAQQHLSLANPTIVTKLQYIHVKTKLVYTDVGLDVDVG